jgi:hypothetical protein
MCIVTSKSMGFESPALADHARMSGFMEVLCLYCRDILIWCLFVKANSTKISDSG